MAKKGIGIALGLGLLLVAASAGGKSGQKSRQQCIDEWAKHVASQIDAVEDPEALGILIQIFQAWGWSRTASCLQQRVHSPTSLGCYDPVRGDIADIRDPAALRLIAENAREENMASLGACFERLANELEAA